MTDLNEATDFEIIDDSGLLALVDAHAYAAFVSPDWNYDQLAAHFAQQAAERRILVWSCGDGGNTYRVHVRDGVTDITGFREVTGTITPSQGHLHFASYTALTMAAQFEDEPFPAKDEAAMGFDLPPVATRVRVVQLFNPATVEPASFKGPHFHIELEPGEGGAWDGIAFSDLPKSEPPRAEGQPRGFLSRLFGRKGR